MNTNNSTIQLVYATKEVILSFIRGAKEKIFIAKPGYTEKEIIFLIELIEKNNVKCTTYIDPDESAIRFGFGESKAIKVAQEKMEILNLQTIKGIRLSIVIVDDKALIFTPAALSWEEEPTELAYPNGLIGGKDLVDKILLQFSGPDQLPPALENITIFPTTTIQQVKKTITEATLKQTLEALEKNPPVDPSTLRQVNLYRNLYKLIKMEVRGANIKNKSLDLRQFNKIFPDINQRLKSSWIVFTNEDIDNLILPKKFSYLISKIEQKLTFDAGRFGRLIKTTDKHHFEKNIERAKMAFINAMKNNIEKISVCTSIKKDRKITNTSDKKAIMSLAVLLQESKKGLIEYLSFTAIQKKDCWGKLFSDNKALYRMMKQNELNETEALNCVIEDFVDNRLKFPKTDEMIEAIDVKLAYYDVSNELLNDEEFIKVLDEYGLKVRKYDSAYEEQDKRRH